MIIREYKESDQHAAEGIFALYWTDPEFLKELSGELNSYLKNAGEKNSSFLVAEENNEVVGIAGFRKLPAYLHPYAQTPYPVEFYVIAVKFQRKGIGEKLKLRLIEEAQKSGFSEMLLYSPHTHDGSWDFHDTLGFERVGEITPPEDEIGHLWRKVL
jgi:L-amino acid N-acyltransferase YncA